MNIENKKQVATILLAIGLGLVATFLTSQYVTKSVTQQTQMLAQDYKNQTGALLNEIELLKNEYRKLAAQQVALARQPASSQPKEVASPPEASFSMKTPPGKRALTVLIDSLSAEGGLIKSGDFIDIIAQLNIPDPQDPKAGTQKVTTVLFQNIQVLAIGTNFFPSADISIYQSQQQARSLYVTLALDPEEAGLIVFAQSNGKLQLSLRSPDEKETKVLQVASWDALSDFVLERQGTELMVPKERGNIEAVEGGERPSGDVKPFIQIFKGGQQL